MGNLFALISSALTGLSYTIFRKSKVKDGQKYLAQALFSFIVMISYLFITGHNFQFQPQLIVIALLSSVLAEAVPLIALQRGNLAINMTLFSTYPVFTFIFSWLINGETINIYQTIAVAVTLIGVAYLGVIDEYLDNKKIVVGISAGLAILAALSAGLSDSISKFFIIDSSINDFLFALALSQIPVAIMMISIQEKRIPKLTQDLKLDRQAIISGILMAIGLIFFWYGLGLTITGIASSITAASAVFTILFALLILGDKPKLLHFPGILITLAGVIALTIT